MNSENISTDATSSRTASSKYASTTIRESARVVLGDIYPELESEDAVIAVMGPTGTGKSYFVRAATGDQSVAVGATLQSVTQTISAHRVRVNHRQVVLLDTPGFDDTFRSDGEVLRDIAEWLATSYSGGHRLTAIIYLHRISDTRMAGSSMRNLRMFKKLIGDDALKNVVLVTTMWDSIDQGVGEEREMTLRDTPEFWGIMVARGSTVDRFDGTRKGAFDIIQSLLNRNTRALTIQKEMITYNLPLADTGAGQEVFASILELKRQHESQIKKLRSDMEEALSQNDKVAAEEISKRSAEHDRRLAAAEAQIDLLQSQNPEMEALRIKHEQDMKALKDSLEDRMRFLEEQTRAPPPAYAEAGGMTSGGENIHDAAEPANHRKMSILRFDKFHFWALLSYIGRLIQKLLRPGVPAGYRRLEWTCTCGEYLFGDFKEGSPGSLDKLAARLQEQSSRAPGQSSSQPSSGAPTSMTAPPKLHLRRVNRPMNWSFADDVDQGDPSDLGGEESRRRAPYLPPARKALQLCIETSKYSLELGELDIDTPQSDGILFQRIRKKYEQIRYSVLPMSLRVSKPDRAVFIKFRLSRHPFVSPIEGSIDQPSIPPKEEVIAGNYEYDPCPIDGPPIDHRTFFHHFYSPASQHPDMMWGPRFPRKLGSSLTPMTQAWGIHLEERPNWSFFITVNLISLLASGAIAGIYSWKTNDTPTGVAIGAWLTAVQTLTVTAVFFGWK